LKLELNQNIKQYREIMMQNYDRRIVAQCIY
jgi:hypothetical protein